MFLARVSAIFFALTVQPAFAHEFWISPERYQIAPGETVGASFRVGELMKGASFSYIARKSERFDVVRGGEVSAVTARSGDNPAFEEAFEAPGLWVIVHETDDSTLTYQRWEKFEAFVAHKAFPTTLAEHAERGLPESGFQESYRRFAKALIAVGDGSGADRAVGLRTEIVALVNPYVDDLSAGLPVQVLFEGMPRADAQVELFAKDAQGDVSVSLHRTDADGRAVLPMTPRTEYLVDAVKMIALENDDPEAGPVWESLWAALTFKTP